MYILTMSVLTNAILCTLCDKVLSADLSECTAYSVQLLLEVKYYSTISQHVYRGKKESE